MAVVARTIRALCRLLAPGNRRVASRLELALTDEARYRKRFFLRRSERNVESGPVDPWLELVDALGVETLACGVDWKSPAEDIAWNIGRVLAKKRLPAKRLLSFYDEDTHLQTRTLPFIEFAGDGLSAHRVALVGLAIDSDSYELTVLPWTQVAIAQRLAKSAGGRVVRYGPKTARRVPLPAVTTRRAGKFVSAKAGWDFDGGFLGHPGLHRLADDGTFLLDCRRWPPVTRRVGGPRSAVAFAHDGKDRIESRVHYAHADGAWAKRPTGSVRVVRNGTASADLIDALPSQFRPQAAGFAGPLAVFLPTEPTVREGTTRRPLVWNGKRLAPAAGLPDAKPIRGTPKNRFPSFLRQGFARTGRGEDVVVWEGRGWVAKGKRLSPVCRIAHASVHELLVGVPAPGGGFFYVHRLPGKQTAIREVTAAGRDEERGRIERIVEKPHLAPDGAIVLACNRYAQPKAPVLAVFHPESGEWTEVPPEIFGVRKDNQARAAGFGTRKRETFVWILDEAVVKAVPYSTLLALPRRGKPRAVGNR